MEDHYGYSQYSRNFLLKLRCLLYIVLPLQVVHASNQPKKKSFLAIGRFSSILLKQLVQSFFAQLIRLSPHFKSWSPGTIYLTLFLKILTCLLIKSMKEIRWPILLIQLPWHWSNCNMDNRFHSTRELKQMLECEISNFWTFGWMHNFQSSTEANVETLDISAPVLICRKV